MTEKTVYENVSGNFRNNMQGFAGGQAGEMFDKNEAIRNDDFGLNDKRFKSLVYPLQMKPENFYPEAMCFTIKKRVGLSIDDVADIAKGAFKERLGKIRQQGAEDKRYAREKAQFAQERSWGSTDNAGHIVANATSLEQAEAAAAQRHEARTAAIGAGKDVLKDVVEGVKSFHAQAGNLNAERRASAKRTHANNLGHIYLNMPNGIQFQNDANWNATPLGAVGAITKNILGAADNRGQAYGAVVGHAGTLGGAAIGGTIGYLADKMKIPSGVGVGALAGAFAGGSGIQGGLEATLGMTSNPYEEMMFSGITFRTFSFDFIFRPESSDEIKAVNEIINRFRRHSRPSFTKGAFGNSVMDYPMEFDIQFLTAERGQPKLKDNHAMDDAAGGDIVYVENKHLPKIKSCVCDKVSTNYTPNGVWSAYAAGAPIAITMSLGFREKELVMEQDISQGY